MNIASPIPAPFPWFGGKSAVAAEIWKRFGNVPNYVEPFFGSGAVLLGRPHKPKTETINDKDQFVSNFWRAVKSDPEAVAHYCDWPVNEADLFARHFWLITTGRTTLETLLCDPEAYDAKIAGWWCWGLCSWIGAGWCSGNGPWHRTDEGWSSASAPTSGAQEDNDERQLPHLGGGRGINRKLPHLGDAGRGINRKLPHLGGGRGINRQLPHLGDAGRGEYILSMMCALAERLRHVRVCCGDWSRVCGPSPTIKHGITGIFLDPPYSAEAERCETLYGVDDLSVSHAVREWAIANGGNPLFRICLAGYDGEHAMPEVWICHKWKARGGYGSQGADDGSGRLNSERERLWFSPHCLIGTPKQGRFL